MALIRCPECGGNVSDKAPACIHCGFPLGAAPSARRDETKRITTNIRDVIDAPQLMISVASGSVRAAQQMIMSGENIIYATVANVETSPTSQHLSVDTFKRNSKVNGVVVVTSRRVIFCSSILGRGISKQIPISEIQSIDDARDVIGFTKLRICGITEMFVIDGNNKTNSSIKNAIMQA